MFQHFALPSLPSFYALWAHSIADLSWALDAFVPGPPLSQQLKSASHIVRCRRLHHHSLWADPIFICSLTAELIRVFLCFQMFDFFPPSYFLFFNF